MNKKTLLCSISLLIANNTYSQGIPTIDISNIIQTTSSAIESLKQTANQAEQIKKQVEQITALSDQFNAITGNYNMGKLLNSQADKDVRRFVPKSWKETLALIESGVSAGNQQEVYDAITTALNNGQQYGANEIYHRTDTKEAIEYVKQANQIFTSMGISQSTYEATERRYGNIELLTDQIRILTESTAYLNELIRQVSMMNIQRSEERGKLHNQNASDRRSSNATLKYDW